MNEVEMKNKYSAFITEISEILGLSKPVDILKLCATTDLFFQPLEKRIEELEEENKVLAQNLEDTEILNKTYEKKHNDLKKENAELKEKLEVVIALKNEEMGCIETDFNTFKSKAKEIIKTCLGFMQAFGYSPSIDKFVTDAEQFLSEVEK